MTDILGYGIDVSRHQDPATLPWESFRGHVDFVIVRASYGTRLDERAKEHARCAREIGAKVGLYLFFRPDQSWVDQSFALESIADSIKLTSDDIIPALDIEDDPFSEPGDPSPGWSNACLRIVERWSNLYGDAMIYLTESCWRMLGKPEWVLHRPLWIAHYKTPKPSTPAGMPATIWQHRSDVFEWNGPSTAPRPAPPGTVDQNRLLLPLPLVGYRPTSDDQARVRALVAENLRRAAEEPEELETDVELAPETPRVV